MTMFIGKIVGDLGEKRRWRRYEARVKALPASHRTTVEALERYLTHLGVITKGDVPVDVKAVERVEAENAGTRS